MTEEIFILVKCNEKTEQSQKYKACTLVEQEIKKVKGVSKTFFTGKPEADITAFAKWEEDDIQKHVDKIKNINGVKQVEAKIIVPA